MVVQEKMILVYEIVELLGFLVHGKYDPVNKEYQIAVI